MRKYTCSKCGCEIPVARVEAILTATGEIPEVCIKCSDVEKYVSVVVYDHKTAGYIVPINPKNKEVLRQALRVYRRLR